MVKLIACAIPILIFIFGDPVLGVISLFIPFFVFFVSWIIKSNKQQPGETDEDYAKRMERLKKIIQTDIPNHNVSNSFPKNYLTDSKFAGMNGNIFTNKN